MVKDYLVDAFVRLRQKLKASAGRMPPDEARADVWFRVRPGNHPLFPPGHRESQFWLFVFYESLLFRSLARTFA